MHLGFINMFPDPTIGATGGSNNAELLKKPNSDDENQTQNYTQKTESIFSKYDTTSDGIVDKSDTGGHTSIFNKIDSLKISGEENYDQAKLSSIKSNLSAKLNGIIDKFHSEPGHKDIAYQQDNQGNIVNKQEFDAASTQARGALDNIVTSDIQTINNDIMTQYAQELQKIQQEQSGTTENKNEEDKKQEVRDKFQHLNINVSNLNIQGDTATGTAEVTGQDISRLEAAGVSTTSHESSDGLSLGKGGLKYTDGKGNSYSATVGEKGITTKQTFNNKVELAQNIKKDGSFTVGVKVKV